MLRAIISTKIPQHGGAAIVLDNAMFHGKVDILSYAATHKIKFYWIPTNAS